MTDDASSPLIPDAAAPAHVGGGDNLARASRRERQILDILYRVGEVSAADVRSALPDPPSYSAVRALLRILEEKGHVRHREEGGKYLYAPTQARQNVARRALRQVVQTFFGGSVGSAVTTLLSAEETRLSDDDIAHLEELIDRARRERGKTSSSAETAPTESAGSEEPGE